MRFRCNRCGSWPRMFEFEADAPVCPRCGAAGAPLVAVLVDVHFLAPNPKGNIPTIHGRMSVACEPGRTHLATNFGVPWSATGEFGAVTCPRCRGSKAFLDVASADEEFRTAQAMERASRVAFLDLGKDRPCKDCP